MTFFIDESNVDASISDLEVSMHDLSLEAKGAFLSSDYYVPWYEMIFLEGYCSKP